MNNKDWTWVAISGEKPIEGSKSMNKFPSFSEKEQLTKKHGGIVFVYSMPIVSEEGGDSGMLLNYYPKIKLTVEGSDALADFDTGTNQTLIPDSLSQPEPGSIPEEGIHLGRNYEYCINQRALMFHSYGESDHSVGPIDMPVAIVRGWNQSPWTKINPNRGALVGRDLFVTDTIIVQITSTAALNVSTTVTKKEK